MVESSEVSNFHFFEWKQVQDAVTNAIDSENALFVQPCTCDLTPNGCDHACCCDPFCSAEAVAAWRLTPGFCLDEVYDNAQLDAGVCMARHGKPVLQDLQGGLI